MGHIDLLDTISYFEVPERDARKVMTQLTGIRYKGRQVRCNDADDTSAKYDSHSTMKNSKRDFRGPKPDFTEEGWARRKPKKSH